MGAERVGFCGFDAVGGRWVGMGRGGEDGGWERSRWSFCVVRRVRKGADDVKVNIERKTKSKKEKTTLHKERDRE